MSRNLAASVRARLKQHADVWYDMAHRPTRDADLLGFGPDDVETAVNTFRQICQTPVTDAIVFDPASVKGSIIRKEAGYGGVRIDLQATLDGARIALQVDIGFGDAVTPAPQTITYPVLLDEFPAPQLRAYPKCTVIAEKFHAVCLLGLANTRMKDYFDLWVLLNDTTIDRLDVRRAIQATLERRKLIQPHRLPIGLTDTFSEDAIKQTQWKAFLKKNRLDHIELTAVVNQLREQFQDLEVI